MTRFGRELVRRGHRFTMFHTSSVEPLVSKAGLSSCPISGEEEAIAHLMERMDCEAGVSFRTYPEYMRINSLLLCKRAPDALRASGIDYLLVDQEEPGGSTAADIAGIPFISICCSLPLNQEPGIPPGFLPWPYRQQWWATARNTAAYKIRDLVIRPVFKAVNAQRKLQGLKAYTKPDDSFSEVAQISQLIPEFDFPRKSLPGCFHYVGPFLRDAEEPELQFPFERLDGRPLIYVYVGGASGLRKKIIQQIATACASLDCQVVIALGETGELTGLAGQPIVVNFAPQRRLLTMATLVISHGGFSTAMEALAAGVPVVAIPFSGDQPGVGARVTYAKVGETLAFADCQPEALRAAIIRVLTCPEYRLRTRAMQSRIADTGGIPGAIDLIEQRAGLVKSRAASRERESQPL